LARFDGLHAARPWPEHRRLLLHLVECDHIAQFWRIPHRAHDVGKVGERPALGVFLTALQPRRLLGLFPNLVEFARIVGLTLLAEPLGRLWMLANALAHLLE
jgi:hypothetical protein